MAETPDEILRALADPERLAIAGTLARDDRSATELADEIGVPLARVHKHLNRLTATGVVRVNDDRHTYRLDPETLRWAAEQVGPPREAGLALGAANDEEEAVLRTFFRNGRLTEIPAKESKRRIVLERIALEFEPGERYDEKEVNVIVGRLLQRLCGVATLPGRLRIARSRGRRLLARRWPRRSLRSTLQLGRC